MTGLGTVESGANTASAPQQVGRFVAAVWRGAVGDRVAAGRLREVGWPYGLRAVVILTGLLYVLAATIALLSAPVRRTAELLVPQDLTSSIPVQLSWLLVFLMVFGVAVFHAAAIHGPWWLTGLGLLASSALVAVWAVGGRRLGPTLLVPVLTLLLIIVLVIVTVLRRRRPFAWWELPVLLVLLGAGVALGLGGLSVNAADLGFRLTPLYTQQTVDVLVFLVLPAALAAGAAVAEITVGATVVATRQVQRQSSGRWAHLVLATAVGIRLLQARWELLGWDPVNQGFLALGPALVLAAAFAGLAWLISAGSRTSSGAGLEVAVTRLPEELGRIGVPLGAAVIFLVVPTTVVVLGVNVLVALAPPSSVSAVITLLDLGPALTDVFRLLLGLALVGLGVGLARRGRTTRGLLLGCCGIVLVALAMRLLTGYRWALWIDPDALNLIATVTTLVVITWHLARRSLTAGRAAALAGLLVLSALFSQRAVLADPIGEVLGYSGVIVVLFGLTWDFLTGSDWANGDSRRFPRPVRVLLVISYTLMTATLLAYSAVVRKSDTSSDLEAMAELGDVVLGTGLLAAAFLALLSTVRTERALEGS